jgi:bifunctional non-homologous end joining protein LigD
MAIADEAWHIAAASAIVDGEIVPPAEDGTTDFSVVQNELKGRSKKIVMVAFDLLYLNGQDLRKLPLTTRNAALKTLLDGTDIQFSASKLTARPPTAAPATPATRASSRRSPTAPTSPAGAATG